MVEQTASETHTDCHAFCWKRLICNWAGFVQCSGSQPVVPLPLGVRETSSGHTWHKNMYPILSNTGRKILKGLVTFFSMNINVSLHGVTKFGYEWRKLCASCRVCNCWFKKTSLQWQRTRDLELWVQGIRRLERVQKGWFSDNTPQKRRFHLHRIELSICMRFRWEDGETRNVHIIFPGKSVYLNWS